MRQLQFGVKSFCKSTAWCDTLLIAFEPTNPKLQHRITSAKDFNILMPFDSEKKITVPPTTASTAVEPKPSSIESVPEASLPKLVVCFDISTLSLEDLQAIAKDIKVPGYSNMTSEQLCEALLAL